MKSFIVACITVVVVAVIAGVVLTDTNPPVDKAFVSSSSVRL